MMRDLRIITVKQRDRAIAALCLFLACSAFAAAQSGKLVPLAPSKLKALNNNLDIKLLPDSSREVEIEKKQVFDLVSQTAALLTIVPVRFHVTGEEFNGDKNKDLRECGVYVIPQQGKRYFIWTLDGSTDGPSGVTQCGGIEAIGLQPVAGSSPAIILIYAQDKRVFQGSTTRSYVLSLTKDDGKYWVNQSLTGDVEENIEEPTVRKVQQFLSKEQ